MTYPLIDTEQSGLGLSLESQFNSGQIVGLHKARKWVGAQASALHKLGTDTEKRKAFIETYKAITQMQSDLNKEI